MAISNNSTGLRPGVCTSSTRPTAPYEGQHIYETDTDIEYVWSGSAWVVNYVSAASPAFTGTPTAPTASGGTNTTQLATTAFVTTADNLKANLASPAFTGSGSTNATTYNTATFSAGAQLIISNQKTTGVSTSKVVIMGAASGYGSLVLVSGSDGTNRFYDVILCGLGTGTVNVISSLSISGSPAARSYDQSSSSYRVSVASGTYTVSAIALGIDP